MFSRELIQNVLSALVAVYIVIYLVTGNVIVTNMVLLCVTLVDLFLFGLLAFWNVELNSVTVVNIVIAIGLAVDYSAHIGHSYLIVQAPDADKKGVPLTDMQKRHFKARGALKEIGGSVFHGAFSTFLAICVLAPSQSYIFKSFYRMWTGIIIFGTANGFVLLPVILALWGPLQDHERAAPVKKVRKA